MEFDSKCPKCGSEDIDWRWTGIKMPPEAIAYECFECEHEWEKKIENEQQKVNIDKGDIDFDL